MKNAIGPAALHARRDNAVDTVRREVVAGGIVVAAAIMFVGNGSQALSDAIFSLNQAGGGSERVLTITILLNVALILFGWRRYKDLRKEIEERKAAQQMAQQFAYRDPLTNLLNRRSLTDRSDAIIKSSLGDDVSLAYLMVDLDRFKNVNDVHGHMVGDMVLSEIAKRITAIAPDGAS